jgi:hypothetical protein
VALLVRRQSGENTVAVADAVKAELERIRPDLPSAYQMEVALDDSRFIESAIRDVAVDLAWGALFASLVVFVFLRNLRSTLLAAVAIPSSIVASFAFFYFLGFTLNTMTLMALSLSIWSWARRERRLPPSAPTRSGSPWWRRPRPTARSSSPSPSSPASWGASFASSAWWWPEPSASRPWWRSR